MREYIPKDEVLDIIKSMPRDLVEEYIHMTKGIWLDDDGEKQVTGKLNNSDDSLLTKNLEVCKEQKSKLDCISRQQAIEAVVNEWKGGFPQTNFLRTQGFHDWLKRILDDLPPVNKNNAEIATSDGEESTMGQPKSKLYIPLNKYTVDRVNQLLKNECGEYFDEEWLYNELEQIAERIQLSPETSTTSKTETVDTDLISRQAAIEAVTEYFIDESDKMPYEYDEEVKDDVFTDMKWAKISLEHNKGIRKVLKSLPPVEPKPVCEDAISRADTIKAMCSECEVFPGDDMNCADCAEVAVVRGMPPVEPKRPKTTETMMVDGELIEIDPLSYEVGYTHGQSERLKEDVRLYIPLDEYAVKRVNRLLKNECGEYFDEEWLYNELEQLAVLYPKRPKGEWVRHELWNMPWYTCSECNFHGRNDYKFCPNCGADMRGDKE